ncbi:hypothetical protein DDZ14_08605 [Maritimibacter sp. 55A14]|uniref:Rz1-like lysis system protein LysC n=1 Tax=Maritimibacter sp. 55A14 TaxID=2174844 RepID=UPI000D603616|nr:hypothetical protein [Maritimibacter sp. 55A14]PWE32796.1 hypothetical protein DDZ14_08605 [Maritimibacter sp. 55A14]
MNRFHLVWPIFLTACATTPQIEYVRPDIPAETLTPCPISERKVETVKELAVLATEHLRAAECAKGKIETLAEVLRPR